MTCVRALKNAQLSGNIDHNTNDKQGRNEKSSENALFTLCSQNDIIKTPSKGYLCLKAYAC